jgi:CPA2 family monovalent cation:H+ antiporter-2
VFGVTLVAILRDDKLIEHPGVNSKLEKGDTAYVMGRPEQIAGAFELFGKKEPALKEG